MACRGDPNDPNEPFESPHTPKYLLKEGAGENLQPDTEDHVASQTDSVFRHFVFHMHTTLRPDDDADESINLPEIAPFQDQHATEALIGRQLALIGDDINTRFAPQFQTMIAQLNVSPDTAYEAFAGVARKLFRDRQITWRRVVTLLCFGYRMATTVLQRGIRGFYSRIVSFVCRFIVVEKIAQWIADQGGWGAVLLYVPETIGWPTMGAIVGAAALALATVFFLTKPHP